MREKSYRGEPYMSGQRGHFLGDDGLVWIWEYYGEMLTITRNGKEVFSERMGNTKVTNATAFAICKGIYRGIAIGRVEKKREIRRTLSQLLYIPKEENDEDA